MSSLRSAGIALAVFGILAILAGFASLFYPHHAGVGNDTTIFLVGLPLGVVLMAVGGYLYLFGDKSSKKGVA